MCQSVNNTIIWFFINCCCCCRRWAWLLWRQHRRQQSRQQLHEILNKVKQRECVRERERECRAISCHRRCQFKANLICATVDGYGGEPRTCNTQLKPPATCSEKKEAVQTEFEPEGGGKGEGDGCEGGAGFWQQWKLQFLTASVLPCCSCCCSC